MNIQFITGMSLVTSDPAASRKLYIDALGLPLAAAAPGDDYYFSEHVDGSRHFGVWPLAQAAQACFGTPDWPADKTVPQVSIEFDVETAAAVDKAAQELTDQGYELLHPTRTEPWGQTVARVLSPEGAIIGISYAPWQHANAPATA